MVNYQWVVNTFSWWYNISVIKADITNNIIERNVFMNIKISENIKRLGKAKKITQAGLAEIFNVTPGAVSKWENKIS